MKNEMTRLFRFACVLVLVAVFLRNHASADKSNSDDFEFHVDAILADVQGDQNVRTFLRQGFSARLGFSGSTKRLAAINAINSIPEGRMRKAKESFFVVFGGMAQTRARRDVDREYALRKLQKLATIDPSFAQQLLPISRFVAREEGRLGRLATDIAAKLRIANPSLVPSPAHVVAGVNDALRLGTVRDVLAFFEKVEEAPAMTRIMDEVDGSLGAVVTWKESKDAAIVVTEAYDGPICLVRIKGEWRICKQTSQFTVPSLPLAEAKQLISKMEELHAWYATTKKNRSTEKAQ